MTEDKILQVLVEIRDFLKIADIRGKRIFEQFEQRQSQDLIKHELKVDQTSGFISVVEIKPELPYDWWRLQNGDYAKIYKIELKGTIYKEDGTMVTNFSPIWNPYSLKNINLVNDSRWDLKNRKFSVEDKGWPEWTK